MRVLSGSSPRIGIHRKDPYERLKLFKLLKLVSGPRYGYIPLEQHIERILRLPE
jgi:hypothetical protein